MSVWAIFNLWDSLLIQLASIGCSILISLPKPPSAALNGIWISCFLSRNRCIFHYMGMTQSTTASQFVSLEHKGDTTGLFHCLSPLDLTASVAAASVKPLAGAGCPPWGMCPTWQLQEEITSRSLPSPSYVPACTHTAFSPKFPQIFVPQSLASLLLPFSSPPLLFASSQILHFPLCPPPPILWNPS